VVRHRLGEGAKTALAFDDCPLGVLSRGDLNKEHGKAIGTSPAGPGLEPAIAQGRDVDFKLNRLAGIHDIGVDLDQLILNTGNAFADRPADCICGGDARLNLEGRAQFDEGEVVHPAICVSNGLTDEKAFLHLFEETSPAGLTLA
jgi:hypothetical protein